MAASISFSLFRHLALLVMAATLTLSRTRAVGSRPESDRVTGLPGQPPVGFGHYAGYIGVGHGNNKALFYWFFEAQGNVDEKPLLLWLNGGPGCSSIAYGAAQELGPFLVRSNTTNLTLNPYAWNKAANLLFLESPVGVGFSYSNRSSDYNLGDRLTAKDSYTFLLAWLQRFPEFKSRDVYISGESYAGHYIPQLADAIFEGNKVASRDAHINLKGFMMGNAVMDDTADMQGMVEYAWSHAIISDELHSSIREECRSFSDHDLENKNCLSSLRSFSNAYDDIDIYSIYTPVCLSQRHEFKTDHWHWTIKMRAGYDPCREEYVETYFNNEDVQQALHANVTHLPYPYSTCSQVIKKWNDSPSTMLPVVRKLMNAGLRIWVYSGDTDGRIPVTSTRNSIAKMGLRVKQGEGWRAWYYGHQVAGWVVEYEEGLTFATMRGAGHQVPAFAPDRSLSLLSHFLAGHPLPSSLLH